MLEEVWRASFSYDPSTGAIVWVRNRKSAFVGKRAERKMRDGYFTIRLREKTIQAHRLAWFLHYGEFPDGEIDHINRDKKDNRIVNLRVASRSQNQFNTAARGDLPKGVTKHSSGRFQAQIKAQGKSFYLGLFDNPASAHAAYANAAKRLHGKFARLS